MRKGRLSLLLFLWCLLVVAPGVLTLVGVFGPFETPRQSSQALAALWVGGYLSQFAVFLWISKVTKNQNFFTWFAASLLPWGFDWILPVHPLYGIPLFAILIGTAYWIAAKAARKAALVENGVRATGVVLEVFKPWMNVIVNKVYIRRKMRLRIERRDGATPYEALFRGLFMLGWIFQFVGHSVYEHKSPAFLTNFLHLLVGPLWILNDVVPVVRAARPS